MGPPMGHCLPLSAAKVQPGARAGARKTGLDENVNKQHQLPASWEGSPTKIDSRKKEETKRARTYSNLSTGGPSQRL